MAYAAGTTIKATKRLNDPYRDQQGNEQNQLLVWLVKVLNRINNVLRVLNGATIADATAAGKLKTVGGTIEYTIDGEIFSKAATDNLWDFTAQVDTPLAELCAFWLYLDASGTASIERASANAATAAAAKAVLLADGEPQANKAVIGVFVAGADTDFSMDAILAVVGATIEYGIPADMLNPCPASQVTGA